jgi:hypothetical protein|eukprot:SAG25_NODE_83_length_16558_cov_10.239307_5_plen_194_part_00
MQARGLVRVEADGTVHALCKGPSAGQSTVVVLLDLLLGVDHEHAGRPHHGDHTEAGAKTTTEAAAFQLEMAGYMPARHRRLLLDVRAQLAEVEGGGSVREYCVARDNEWWGSRLGWGGELLLPQHALQARVIISLRSAGRWFEDAPMLTTGAPFCTAPLQGASVSQSWRRHTKRLATHYANFAAFIWGWPQIT